MKSPESFAAAALQALFKSSVPRGRGPIEARSLYKLWISTGLRRDDLAWGIRLLTDRGLLHAEHQSGSFYYTLNRVPAADRAGLDGQEQDSILSRAALRALGDPTLDFGRRSSDSPEPPTGAQKRRAQQSRLLLCLNGLERAQLEQHMELVHLKTGEILWERGERMRYLYFPTDCIISQIVEMADGASCEVGMVGNEGVADVMTVLGGQHALRRSEVGKGGYAYRIPAEVLRSAFDGSATVREVLLGYYRALLIQIGQTAACNRHHSIEQQLCRLLLSSIDRMRSNRLEMTHEQVARILGVRREGITEALGRLRSAGIIGAERGAVQVRDRQALAQRSCECYSVIRHGYDRIRPRARPEAAP